MKNEKQKIVTIGGGTGSFTVLSGLKKYDFIDLTAIVSMADDGGSTGILQDELGVLPPGDIRQCLVALAKSSNVLRELFNYRYSNGGLAGHNFGNIFLSTLEKVSGSFNQSIKEAAQILRIRGKVLPVTLQNTKLVATFDNGRQIIGEDKINQADLANLKKINLEPKARVNPEVIEAITQADTIIINPGNFFCSIIPNFLVNGLASAVVKAKAKKMYLANLMTKPGHTDQFTVINFIETLEKYIGDDVIDYVIYNKEVPENFLLKKYARQGEYFVQIGDLTTKPKVKFIGQKLLNKKIYQPTEGDLLSRTLIRHNSDKLAKTIINLLK